MELWEVSESFSAMDSFGHSQNVPKSGILYSVGDASGFRGRSDVGELASFVYLGSLLYVKKTTIEAKTRALEPTKVWRQRYTQNPASRKRRMRAPLPRH